MDQLVETRESHKFSRTLKASLLMAVLVIGSVSYIPFAYAAISPIPITTDTQLTADLTFSSSGFIIDADDITLDLNGHTITGPFLACAPACPLVFGIDIDGHTGVTVKNGIVEGFVLGVRLNDADNNVVKSLVVKDSTFNGISLFSGSDNNVIKGNTLEDNGSPGSGFGLIINGGEDNLVTENTFTGNAVAGVMLFSSGTENNEVKGNDISGNDRMGVFVQASVANVVTGNTISGNVEFGVFILNAGIDNVIEKNTITGNLRRGIFNVGSHDVIIEKNTVSGNGEQGIMLVAGASGNEISKNVVEDNGSFGIQLSSSGNTITKNDVTGHSPFDVFDTTGGGGNTYVKNSCGSSNLAGVC